MAADPGGNARTQEDEKQVPDAHRIALLLWSGAVA
jgi:hypothetical protein